VSHVAGGNHLLRTLTPTDFAALAPHLTEGDLSQGTVVEEPGAAISDVWFPDAGIISVVAIGGDDRRIETGLIGREGMTGCGLTLGDDRGALKAYVQVAGHGRRIAADRLRIVMDAHGEMRAHFALYARAFSIQTAHTALANGRFHLDCRLARWLAMAQDRTGRDDVAITHEFLGLTLGVRRAGVTDGLHKLEGEGLVRSVRGNIRITDRARLLALAGGSYGIPEETYRRLLGDPGAVATAGEVNAIRDPHACQ
jgi:CRP-like cAMP-binding protein